MRRSARTASIPAPTGGLNARDNIAEMPPTDAVIMRNYMPTPSDVMLRKGYTNHVTGITGTVETLMAYENTTASKLFAAAGAAIYDVTSAGAVGAAVVGSLTNARFQHTNFGTTGGSYLYAVNGADKPQLYNGTTWTAIDGTSTPAITGVTTTNLIHVNVFKRRLWFVEKSSMRVWYLPVDSIGGAASSIDFGALFKLGGYLMAMGTWTLDAGEGVDDYAVFLSSQGEIAVYRGTDPSSVATWALVGIWQLGSPVGRRCLMKWGSDLLIICRDGLLSFSKALMSSRVNTKAALSDKIQTAISTATSVYGANFGWQIQPYPAENMLILNVPTSGTESNQYAMNSITGAWGRFTGWNAACWEKFGDNLYFGTASTVCKAWSGNSDNGSHIEGEVLPAFNYFGNRASVKHFKMGRPVISTDGSPGVLLGINTDFDVTAPTGNPTFTTSTFATWDSGIWDAGTWGGELQIKKSWQTVGGIGYCASLHLLTRSAGVNIRWASSDYVFEIGGVIG